MINIMEERLIGSIERQLRGSTIYLLALPLDIRKLLYKYTYTGNYNVKISSNENSPYTIIIRMSDCIVCINVDLNYIFRTKDKSVNINIEHFINGILEDKSLPYQYHLDLNELTRLMVSEDGYYIVINSYLPNSKHSTDPGITQIKMYITLALLNVLHDLSDKLKELKTAN